MVMKIAGILALTVSLTLPSGMVASPGKEVKRPPDIEWFFDAAGQDEVTANKALKEIGPLWEQNYAALIIDIVDVLQINPNRTPTIRKLLHFLQKQTGKKYGTDLDAWRKWIWSLDYHPHPEYVDFQAVLYAAIDPRMAEFFPPQAESTIRLDQIEWGGVRVNGIPPLDHPKNTSVDLAGSMSDSDLIFGLYLNGESRAYPQKIIAYHELVRDRLGGQGVTLVYCTLCGVAMPYLSEVDGEHRTFGTSGLLYRSNKLLFDEESKTLWSTLQGEPVVGELVGSGARLTPLPIVTTSWGEWRAAHPDTTVVSAETGHDLDYTQGTAYRDYFATDELMFQVPNLDSRLKNKAEVLVMTLGGSRIPVAISARFLKKNRVFTFEEGDESYTVVTSRQGANRVYKTGAIRFPPKSRDGQLKDSNGDLWRLTEDSLVPARPSVEALPRIPAQRAFWFGWYSQYPETRLIK